MSLDVYLANLHAQVKLCRRRNRWSRSMGTNVVEPQDAAAVVFKTEKEALGESAGVAGYSHQSGIWATYLSRFRSLDLISGRGELKAEPLLFADSHRLDDVHGHQDLRRSQARRYNLLPFNP
jgi:hypothetical protein